MSPDRQAYYASLAKHYKAESLSRRCKATIYLEDKNDEAFWSGVLSYAYPNEQFNFISYTRLPSGNIATGCTQCLAYTSFLDDKLAIAIDSDMRYLKQDSVLNHQYVLHTYTYSFENHLCFVQRIEEIFTSLFDDVLDLTFDIRLFLSDYSSTIYPLILCFLDGKITVESLNEVTSLPFTHDTSLDNNGQPIIQMLRTRVQDVIGTYTPSQRFQDEFRALGLCEDTAYLYARGHNLYNLIYRIGKNLCNMALQHKRNTLLSESRQDDIPALYSTFFKEFDNQLESSRLLFSYTQMQQCIDKIRNAWS